jgi:hypothetical protein
MLNPPGNVGAECHRQLVAEADEGPLTGLKLMHCQARSNHLERMQALGGGEVQLLGRVMDP